MDLLSKWGGIKESKDLRAKEGGYKQKAVTFLHYGESRAYSFDRFPNID